MNADLYSSARQCCALLMTKVLVSDPIDQAGIDILSQVAQVDQRPGLSPEELINVIGEYDGLMIRSGTQVTAEVIAAASRLKIIGRAGVGVDNVDVPSATREEHRQDADAHAERRDVQRQERGDHRRDRDGERELTIELAGKAADEGERHEHRQSH